MKNKEIKILLAKTILELPGEYLEISEKGRLDFPRKLRVCSGSGKHCNSICLFRALCNNRTKFWRGKTNPEDIQGDFCREEEDFRLANHKTYLMVSSRVDLIKLEDYWNYVLPIILEQYKWLEDESTGKS